MRGVAGGFCLALAMLPTGAMAAALAGNVSEPSCFVGAAVGQPAFVPATVRVAVVSDLTKLEVYAPASIV